MVAADGSTGSSLTASPCFARSSSTSPNSMARMGHASTHTGLRPSSRSALQASHFTIMFSSSSNCGAP